MATPTMRTNKDGARVFKIRCKINGVEYTKTWPDRSKGEPGIPSTWSDKRARTEAGKIAALFEDECKRGLVSTDRRTLSEYAEYVINFKETTGVLKPKTIAGYRGLMKRIDASKIGPMMLSDIRASHLNAFYKSLAEDTNEKNGGKLSAKTIREYHALIHSVLQQAMKESVIPYNPAAAATPPSVKPKEADCYTPEQISAVLEAMKSEPQRWKALTYLLIGTGARRGEIAGLQWSDIDFESCRIRIRRNVVFIPGRGCVVGSPKTGEERTISVAPEALEELRKWRSEQAEVQGAFSISGFCFALEEMSEPIPPDSITRYYAKLGRRYGLGHIHPHGFRHTQASIILQSGDVVMASKRLGHSRTSTTLDIYGHMMPSTDKDAAEKIGEVFFRNAK